MVLATHRKLIAMTAADRPLAGLLILDLVQGRLAPLTRIYADLGADVVRVADPQAPRARPPREDLALELGDLGKQRHSLDLAKPDDAGAFDALLRRAHLVVCGGEENDATLRTPIEAVAAERPELVVMDVSLFGRSNTFSSWQATDPVLQALSGMLSRSGVRGREPLLPPGELAISCALAQAAYAGLAALYDALATGRGDRLDIAALDGAAQALDPGFGVGGTAMLGRPASALPRERPEKGLLYPIFQCADGHVRICLLARRQWQGMFRWLGEPQAFAGPEFQKIQSRQQSSELTTALAAFFAGKSRADLEREGQAFGVPIAGLRALEECLASEHLAARNAVVEVDLQGGRAPVPNGVVEIDGVRMGVRIEARPSARPAFAYGARAPGRLPLAGLKVLDLGVIVVGAEQGRLLADLGADVVKVESAQFPDGARLTYLPTGLSASFAVGHRNKRSLGLNLRAAEGQAIFRRLAASADIVLSNFKPGTLESLGVGHGVLSALNPALVSLESSAFGADGPWAGRMGYGPLVRAAAGLTQGWRYPDDPESFSDSVTVYPDHVAARIGATAALALLIRRLRTGRGGVAKIAQLEVMLDHLASDIAARALGDPSLSEPSDAPWGVYPAVGDDEWCVVTVRDDDDWRRLAPIIGWEASQTPGRKERLAASADLDASLRSWLSARPAQEAMEILQAAGVPAGRMLRAEDLPGLAYYQDRRAFRAEPHPHMDEMVVAERLPVRGDRIAEPPTRPAPVMGEHTAEIARDWLDLGAAEVERLIAAGVLEPTPPEIAGLIARGEGRRAVS